MSKLSRRNIIGGSLASSAALLTGKTPGSAAESGEQTPVFKNNGKESMTLEEFRELNGPGSVAKLMGHSDHDLLSMCHKEMTDRGETLVRSFRVVFDQVFESAGGNIIGFDLGNQGYSFSMERFMDLNAWSET